MISQQLENPLIKKERYLLLFKLTPIMMGANLLASPILVALMWGQVAHHTLLIWLAIIVLACILTLIFYYYLKPQFKKLTTIPDKHFYLQLPFLFGIIWGAAGFFFFTPHSTTHIAYLVIFLFGMTSGAINALSSLWLAYAALVIPALIPFSIRLLQDENLQNTFLAGTILTFLIIMLVISKITSKSVGNSLRIRYENINLLKKLRIQTDQAEKANQDKSRFLAAASHDLRQPVHSLSLLTSAISPEIQTERGRKILSQISVANDVMLNLLNSLLDMSKLDAGVIKPDIQVLNLQQIISSLVHEFQPIAKQNGLELRSRCSTFIINSDRVLLSTIIRNIIQNAIRYTPSGKILVACRKRNNKILLQIWDTGKGIVEEHQEKIFAEFQQLHNPERDQNKGLGLGLAICRRLAILLNIQITLNSIEGKGSVFTLELAISPDQKNIRIPNKSEYFSKNISSPMLFEDATILVIDDNQGILEAITVLLENWGCQVITADSIEATLEVAKNHEGKINAIIADYNLRQLTTGAEAIEAFNQHAKHVAAGIIITGETAPKRMQEITSHGFPVLHKPVKEPHLKTVIGRLLRIGAKS